MERIKICDVKKRNGEAVKVQGFVENIRISKTMIFVVMKDLTGRLQITVEKSVHPELAEEFEKLTADSVITVMGKAVENEYVKMGGVEVLPEKLEIESIEIGRAHV